MSASPSTPPRFVGLNERGHRVGQDHHNASMTDRDIELMRALREDGMRLRDIAEKLECSKTQVSQVCSGKRRCQRAVEWKRVVAGQPSTDVPSSKSSMATTACAASSVEPATSSAPSLLKP